MIVAGATGGQVCAARQQACQSHIACCGAPGSHAKERQEIQHCCKAGGPGGYWQEICRACCTHSALSACAQRTIQEDFILPDILQVGPHGVTAANDLLFCVTMRMLHCFETSTLTLNIMFFAGRGSVQNRQKGSAGCCMRRVKWLCAQRG